MVQLGVCAELGVALAAFEGGRVRAEDVQELGPVAPLAEARGCRPAGVLAGGWSLSGDPIWENVRRLPRGIVLTLRPGEPESATELLPLERIARLPGAGFEPDTAARLPRRGRSVPSTSR